jgi:biotin carboxyl carrier protein
MIKATVNDKAAFNVDIANGITCNGEAVDWSAALLPNGNYSVIMDNRSVAVQLRKIDRENKTVSLQVEGRVFDVKLDEPIDQLLAAMGIKDAMGRKVNDIKAPMPGLVLQVLVSPGQAIKKGDPVLILEAMKMENVFKATSDAIVKEVKVAPRTAVEKGQVLIILE